MFIQLTHHAIGDVVPLAVNVDHIIAVRRRKVTSRPSDQEPDVWYNLLLLSNGKEFVIAECPEEVACLANGEPKEAMFAKSNRPGPGESGLPKEDREVC
jgi:hypothetical protein